MDGHNWKVLLWCCVMTIFIVFVQAQGTTTRKGNICLDQKTCGACIAAGPECGWCKQEGYDKKNKERCDLKKNLIPNGCDASFVVMPKHEKEYVKNSPPRNSEGDIDAIQLTPQQMKVKIRPNSPFEFNMAFRQAENYPVDLYYVMDLSFSMKDDKDKLAELGDLLSAQMSNITKNFRLGFGSFIDKKTMPYVSTVPSSLREPCTGCAAPYGFKNQLSLTTDTPQFRTKVLAAAISGNLDAPEGGFDAMMQAIVCKDDIGWRSNSRKMILFSTDEKFHYAGDGKRDIGWRNQSRRMLLFSTDAGFHFAGDGKLGGIVKPNDGYCHLDGTGEYSQSLYQDYPSISQISNKVVDEKVNVIFAVTKNQLDVYKKLSKFIEGSVVGELANDSSNVVKLVNDNYKLISSVVEMKVEVSEGVYVKFQTKCKEDEEFKEEAMCRNVTIGQSIQYKVSIEVTECPKKKEDWKKTVTISPVGLAETLKIDMEMICECQCELPENEVTNSAKCNSSGTYECGACTCNEGFYGKNCECDGSTVANKDYDAACKLSNTSKVCEGHGECVCGQCDCYPVSPGDPSKKYSGKFCECDDYSCDYSNSMLCGGPGRGRCHCGECTCTPDYKGVSCDCPVSKKTCIADNGKICNGVGQCECGKCACNKEEKYRGPTCEDCPTCPGKCEANKACVQCRAFETGELSPEECMTNCTHIVLVDHVEENDIWRLCRAHDEEDGCFFYFIYEYNGPNVQAQREKENDNWRKCWSKDEDGCFFYYSYEYSTASVKAQRERDCPAPVNIIAVVLGVIGGIILLGLLILFIWRIVVYFLDRREYAQFEQERQNARWDTAENPIFKPATSTYKNPMK